MKYKEGQSRLQKTLLPDVIDDYIGDDNPVRVIDAYVDTLNLDDLNFRNYENSTGRPPYDPKANYIGLLHSVVLSHEINR